MANLRILHSNALDRATSLAVTSESLSKENLKDMRRSRLWRATAKSASITLQWASPETIRCVCLAHTNFTSGATMTVSGYTNIGDSVAAFTVGPTPCVGYVHQNPMGFDSLPAGINQYAYGGGTYAVLWFAGAAVRRLVINVSDAGNTQNIEASHLIAGDYWSPKFNPGYGAGVTSADSTKTTRSEAGDAVPDRGARYRKINMNLAQMPPADRDTVFSILRRNGSYAPMLVSLYPEDSNKQLEWDHMLWGKLSSVSALTVAQYNAYSNSIDLEEI